MGSSHTESGNEITVDYTLADLGDSGAVAGSLFLTMID